MDPVRHLCDCTVYSTVSQDTDEEGWLAARTRGIGGSDIGAICGVSPYSSARQIYFSKTGQFTDSNTIGPAQQDRMHFGHMLEPVVADEYARRTGAILYNADLTLCQKDYPWALANVDRLILSVERVPVGVLECKTTSEYGNSEWENGDLPISYIYQLNWYMWITGLDRGAFACLVGGNKFYYYDVWINWDLVAEMFAIAEDFWENNVKQLVMPELQAQDTEFVNTENAEVVKNSEIILSDDVSNDLAATAVECKAKIKELTATLEEAQNRLKDRLGNTEIGYTHDYIVKWSPRSQVRVDTDKLKTEFPDIYAKVLKPISFRAMSIKGGSV